MKTFKTHTGEVVQGETLQNALNAVADDWERMARDIRAEDAYASHVTEREKDLILQRDLHRARQIARGDIRTFTVWQRVNTKLTGECVALLS